MTPIVFEALTVHYCWTCDGDRPGRVFPYRLHGPVFVCEACGHDTHLEAAS